jgi:hypothetical protein
MGHSLEVLVNTHAHVIAELKGRSVIANAVSFARFSGNLLHRLTAGGAALRGTLIHFTRTGLRQ